MESCRRLRPHLRGSLGLGVFLLSQVSPSGSAGPGHRAPWVTGGTQGSTQGPGPPDHHTLQCGCAAWAAQTLRWLSVWGRIRRTSCSLATHHLCDILPHESVRSKLWLFLEGTYSATASSRDGKEEQGSFQSLESRRPLGIRRAVGLELGAFRAHRGGGVLRMCTPPLGTCGQAAGTHTSLRTALGSRTRNLCENSSKE